MMATGVPKEEYMQHGRDGYGEFITNINQFGKSGNVFGAYSSVHNDPLPFYYKG